MKVFNRYLFVLISFFYSSTPVISQVIKAGDKIPDMELNQVINHSSPTIKLSDYKGKLIIFDFWGFWCPPCLYVMPKIDSLQQEFADKVKIFLVNRNSSESTIEFFQNRKNIRMPKNIPLVTGDSILKNMFPHEGMPFYVWVDTSGTLLYTTNEAVTREKLEQYFNGNTNLYSKNSKALYVSSYFRDEIAPYVRYGTNIFRCIDTLDMHLSYKYDDIPYRCRSIVDLYQFAFNESDNDSRYKFREHGRTILEVSKPEKYIYDKTWSFQSWRGKYGYYYQSILPEDLESKKYEIMREDLQRYFGLKVSVERRPVKCLALIRTSTRDKLKTKGGEPARTTFTISIRQPDSINYKTTTSFIRNMPFQELYRVIKSKGDGDWGINIIDETFYKGNIDFEIAKKYLDNLTMPFFRSFLKKYDLDLVEKYVIMDVLVLRE